MTNKNHIPALAFDSLTGLYDKVISLTLPETEFRNALIDSAFAKDAHVTVLEFGVGTASNAILAKTKYPSIQITGLDVDGIVLEIAKAKANTAKANIEFVQNDGGQLPFDDNSFEIVISSLVFHHLLPDEKQQAFEEIYRVLKPSGRLVFADWGKPRQFIGNVTFSLLRIFDGWQNTADHSTGNYLRMLQKAGFQVPAVIQYFNTIYGTLELVNTTKL